jgi:predicted glycosyltransferase involved in capsule biosynthesis
MSWKFKNILPKPLKRLAWFLIKSPQRQFGFYKTLWRDVKGLCFFNLRFLKKDKPKYLSVCVGIANRGENLKANVIPSFVKASEKYQSMQLSVFEMGGKEEVFIQKEVQKAKITHMIFGRSDEKFARARAFNQAVIQSSGQLVFLCDADISFNTSFVETAMRVVKDGVAWFPICYALGPLDNLTTGKWMEWDAKGLVVCTRKDFEKIGMLNEGFTSWGGEDVELWNRFHQKGWVVIRNKFHGLYHHWHEPNSEKEEYLTRS